MPRGDVRGAGPLDNEGARELAAKSLRTFFGPDRPYLKNQRTVPHDKGMSSIEMFGKHVIPELKKKAF